MEDKMKKILLISCLLSCCFSVISCSDDTNINNNNICDDGKCDSANAEELTKISMQKLVSCWGVVDPNQDAFFQEDKILCHVTQIPFNKIGEITKIIASVATQKEPNTEALLIEGKSLQGTNQEIDIFNATYENNNNRVSNYPITIELTFEVTLFNDTTKRYFGSNITIENREQLKTITQDSPLYAGLPFDVWQIVLWPNADLQNMWHNGAFSSLMYYFGETGYEFPVESLITNTNLEAESKVLFNREPTYFDNFESLRSTIIYIPAPVNGFTAGNEPSITVKLHDNVGKRDISSSFALTDPGYYVIDPDSNGQKTPANELVIVTEYDNSFDPCKGTCRETEVCIQGSCREKAGPTECGSLNGTCDPGADEDCPEGHFCSHGFCLNKACQEQKIADDGTCGSAYGICENDNDSECPENHVCASTGNFYENVSVFSSDDLVLGTCYNIQCQQSTDCSNRAGSGSCVNNNDCAVDNICITRLHRCRHISCQIQPEDCSSSKSICDEGENSDCAEGHTCVQNKCTRNTCIQ